MEQGQRKGTDIKQLWFLSNACSLIAVYFGYMALAFGVNLGWIFGPSVPASVVGMSGTLASFSPTLGIGLAIGFIVIFIALSTIFASAADSA